MKYASTRPLFSEQPLPVDGPPVKLSKEEFERVWEPRGWNLLPTSMRTTYREEGWGMWEAIRDIVQNALDETEFYYTGYDNKGLWIADKGGGVAIRDFLMGEAKDKKKPDWARGKFGEGMKLACLTAIREGYRVKILTTGREIWAVFSPIKVGPGDYEETLQFLWKTSTTFKGTRIQFIGYTGPAYPERFATNVPTNLEKARTPSPIQMPRQRWNQLFMASGVTSSHTGGVIYSRDIFLREINSVFSYNLWGFPLSPDRHGPKEEIDLQHDIGRTWCGVNRVPLMQMFFEMMSVPPKIGKRLFEYDNLIMDEWNLGINPVTHTKYINLLEVNKLAWNKAWEGVFGKHAVLKTGWLGRWDGWVKHLNYTSVNLKDEVRSAFAMIIKTDAKLVEESQDRLKDTEVIPDNSLPETERGNLEIAREMAKLFNLPGPVNAAVIPPASDNARTAGFYNGTLQAIKIELSQLRSLLSTVDTMIHELAHHIAFLNTNNMEKAEDLTPDHANALSHVGARFIRFVNEGKLDHVLKGRSWR